jgi:hypothetical protein
VSASEAKPPDYIVEPPFQKARELHNRGRAFPGESLFDVVFELLLRHSVEKASFLLLGHLGAESGARTREFAFGLSLSRDSVFLALGFLEYGSA